MENLVLVQEPLIKRWFGVATTQMPIFILLVSARVSFEDVFSLWVALIITSQIHLWEKINKIKGTDKNNFLRCLTCI